MKNIVMTRIDDRLLHGQISVYWVPYLNIEEIVVIDDDYSSDEFLAGILKEAAPEGIEVTVLSVDDGVQYLKFSDDSKRVLVLGRRVEAICSLAEKGAGIQQINIGSLGFLNGRKMYKNYVYLSDDELGLLKKTSKNGVEIEVQMLPNDVPAEVCCIG